MKRDEAPMPTEEMRKEQAAYPPRGQADDGKTGGAVHRGMPTKGNFRGHDAAGINAMTGQASGSENERTAPGISTDKKADDTK